MSEEVQEVLSEEGQVVAEGEQVQEVQEVLSEEVQVVAEGEQVQEVHGGFESGGSSSGGR